MNRGDIGGGAVRTLDAQFEDADGGREPVSWCLSWAVFYLS